MHDFVGKDKYAILWVTVTTVVQLAESSISHYSKSLLTTWQMLSESGAMYAYKSKHYTLAKHCKTFNETTTSDTTDMGILISTLMDRFFPKTPSRILMVGLDNAGKTTVLYKLKLGEVVWSPPPLSRPLLTCNKSIMNK